MNPVIDRLMEERKQWLQDTPNGFSANPLKNDDGTLNLFKWKCEVPGPRNTPWEGKLYKFTIEFDKTNLDTPIVVYCNSNILHPNVDYKGFVCSSLTSFWPEFGLKQIIFGLQSFLEFPNIYSPLNNFAKHLFQENRAQYNSIVRNMSGDISIDI